MKPVRNIARCFFCVTLLYLATACGNNDDMTPATQANDTPSTSSEISGTVNSGITDTVTPQTQFNIGNKSYLFDVSNHTIEEMEALLARANEISELHMHDYPDLEVVMIFHGPNIDWFTRKYQEQNRKLVNLAAKLDAFEIIDMKVCEKTMESRGIKPEDIPVFIEPVPYAPDEIKRLQDAGFVNL